jgi:molybdopterin converting factor small subunit
MVHDEVGNRELEYRLSHDSTVSTLLTRLSKDYPSIGEMVYDEANVFRDYLELAVNQVSIISLDGLETVLREGDLVQVMPPIGGG